MTLPALFGVSLGGEVDLGVALAQYLGAVMLCSAMIALGIFASSLTRNQSVAFIIALFILAALTISSVEFVQIGTPPPFDAIVRQMSLLPHFEPITRGVVDVRDALYFVSVTALGLLGSYILLIRSKVAVNDRSYRLLKIGSGVLVAITVLVNLLSPYIGGRLDLTAEKLYTLSSGSKELLRGLPDIVTITFYSSEQVHPRVAAIQRDVKDMLSDYDREGRELVRVEYKYPDTDAAALEEAQRAGVEPVEFNVVGDTEFQVKQGWLGLAVRYGGKTDIIGLVERTNDLEYRLSNAISRVTRTEKKKIQVIQGHGESSLFAGLAAFESGLSAQYQLDWLPMDKDHPAVSADTEILVIPGGDQPVSRADRKVVEEFIDRGGNALFLTERTKVERTLFIAEDIAASWAPTLARYGVTVDEGMVYDLQSNETVTFGAARGQSFRLPYPPWIRAQTARGTQPVGDLRSVLLLWPSSLTYTPDAPGRKTEVLLETTGSGGRITGDLNITPNDNPQLKRTGLARRVLALSVSGTGPDEDGDGSGDGRLVVIGDTDFISDQYVKQSPENLTFALGAVDWLAQQDELATIRAKQVAPRRLLFPSEAVMNVVRYGCMIGVPFILALYGFLRLNARRIQAREGFEG